MPLVTSDNDLPKLLNTPSKQMKRPKKPVLQHLGSASEQVDRLEHSPRPGCRHTWYALGYLFL
jgi:hypothetical protein